MRRRLAVLAALGIASWLPAAALAQSRTTGAVAGRVSGQDDDALPDAVVEIASPALIGGVHAAATDGQGQFRFSELPPGTYRLTAVAPGFHAVELAGLRVSAGLTAQVPLTLLPLGGEETIEVAAAAPGLDPTTAAAPTIFTADYLRNIPHDRDPTHLLDLAPGINSESAFGGGEESGNAYQIDGVDISDPRAGEPWALFDTGLIEEVQLVGLGAPAEYGQFTGVVFNSITKSGGNDLSGLAEVYYGGRALSSKSKLEDLDAKIESDTDATVQVGGPLRRDRLWFFASGQYVRLLTSEGGPTERETTPRLFGKLTAQPLANTTLNGWAQWDHTRIAGANGDAFTALEATTGEDNPEVVGNLSLASVLSSSSVLSVSWSGYAGRHRFDPHGGPDLPGHVDARSGLASVNAQRLELLQRRRNQLNASLSRHVSDLIAGFHDVKAGIELEASWVRDRRAFPGGAFYSDNEDPEVDPSTRRRDRYSLVLRGGAYDAEGRNRRASFYLQDSWQVTPRLTLSPGVRYDRNRGKVPGATVFRTDPVAPRLGLAWNLGGDGESVLRAHYGRFYEALYTTYYYYLAPGAFAPLTTQRTFNRSGYTDTLGVNPGQAYAMDPDIRHPYLDQYVLGFDRLLPRHVVLSTMAVYRGNADFIETVSRDGVFVPVQGTVPGSGQAVTLFEHRNAGSDVLLYTNPAGLFRTYRALIVSATRPLRDRWQLAASYVWSQARGSIDNLGTDEAGVGANTPTFDGHFLDTPNSLVNAEGRLTHDQTHQVKLQGTRLFPSLHLALSADYTFTSGDTWTPQSTCLLVRRPNGNQVCHDFPQGDVTYLAEPRGSRRLPARNELDLRVEWRRPLGSGGELHVDLDVFNLTNQARATAVEPLAGDELGQPATASFPRTLRLGLGVSW